MSVDAGIETEQEAIARELHLIDCEEDAPEGEDPTLYDEWWGREANRALYRSRAARILARLRATMAPVAYAEHLDANAVTEECGLNVGPVRRGSWRIPLYVSPPAESPR